jgi:hypothetical protein
VTLKHRIADVGTSQARAMGDYHPAGTAATPHVMPIQKVTYVPDKAYPWGTLAVETMTTRYAADGAEIPATTPGGWGKVHAAGRASPAHQ